MSKNIEFSNEVLGSCSINFLFGAGVNGNAFPKANNFDKTLNALSKILRKEVALEQGFAENMTAKNKEKVNGIFLKELKKFEKKYRESTDEKKEVSLENIRMLLSSIYKIVEKASNRTIYTKQVNIFTLNYDSIIEDCLEKLGYLFNSVSNQDYSKKRHIFDIVGYYFNRNINIPTFLVSHLHGNINNPIIPGPEKYNSSITAENFEIVFNMKQILQRQNSILYVIGYSGGDKHFNEIIKDCISNGLTVYWIAFNKEDKDIPEWIINNKSDYLLGDGMTDSTKILSELLEKIWKTKE